MPAAALPKNEDERLQYLRDLNLDRSGPIPELEKLTRLASEIAGTPIALISLVDADLQRFAAGIGLSGIESTPRDIAFCAHAILGRDQLVVPDTREDSRFLDNPLVTGSPDIRAYVGSVLEPDDGIRIGTLCVIDTQPRAFDDKTLAQLDALADAVAALLVAHRDRLLLQNELTRESRERIFLREAAQRDPLTGLLNMGGFRTRVEKALHAPQGTEAFAVIDVDRFKQVNDRHGHPFGDQYLKLIADGLREALGSGALIGRIGGDEFAALLSGGGPAAHAAALERARAVIREAAARAGNSDLGKLSIGMCLLGDAPSPGYDELYQRADAALYATKDRGRDGLTVFSTGTDDLYNLRAQRARFSEALLADEIEPFFQPQVRLADGRIESFELLARWRDPVRGLLTPAHFHRLLTDRSTGPELTRKMVSAAIRTQVAWRRRGMDAVPFAINVTHHDLLDPAFFEDTDWLLAQAGLTWSVLDIEITESAILNEASEEIRRTIEKIHDRGGAIALDDFGTGHASLSHLRDWPITVLKLDTSFVRAIADSRRDAEIVTTIVDLARRLDLRVIAEGIESEAVAGRLLAMGCSHGQGYLFSPPVDEAAAAVLMKADVAHLARAG